MKRPTSSRNAAPLYGGEGYEVQDFGAFNDEPVRYPDIAHALAKAVAERRFDRGVLICGTGIGMAITANKVKGIRAAQCHDTYSAERARMSNDAQIITVGVAIAAPAPEISPRCGLRTRMSTTS